MGATDYAETAALLATLEGDEERVESLISDMLPGERRNLVAALDALSTRLIHRCAHCDGYEHSLFHFVSLGPLRSRKRVNLHAGCVEAFKAAERTS